MSTAEQAELIRTPKKRRGRPSSIERTRLLAVVGRNMADMTMAATYLDPGLKAELSPQVKEGQLSMTLLAYIGRFPREQQREMLERLRPLGARAAKRYVECQTRPPDEAVIATRLLSWLGREFPGVDRHMIVSALDLAAIVARADEEEGPR